MPYQQLIYHLVWSTKMRQPLITAELKPRLYAYIRKQVEKYDGHLYAIGGIEDHIHLLVSIPPKISLATFIANIKGSSTHFVNTKLPEHAPFYWQAEYGALTVSESRVATIINYIKNQQKHHANQTTYKNFEP